MSIVRSETVKRTIAGLAILTSNLEQGKDYLDLFLPLVGQSILANHPKVISVTDIQHQMSEVFGMQIPQNALQLIFRRAEKRNYIIHHFFVDNFEKLSTPRLLSEELRPLRDLFVFLQKKSDDVLNVLSPQMKIKSD